MKYVAYGTSKLLKMYLENEQNNCFDYCIDNFTNDKTIYGLPIFKDDQLLNEHKDQVMIVLFAVSNTALKQIEERLIKQGFQRFKNYMFYSDFFLSTFNAKLADAKITTISKENLILATELNRNINIPVHTTILGNALLFHLLETTKNMQGSIAEIGAYRCGATKLNMTKLLSMNDQRSYYILDSFDGFPVLTSNDPQCFGKGDYNIDVPYEMVENEFLMNQNFTMIKGFVPDTFPQINENEKFSIVFYDCDLYQPALDTFKFFENKIEKGGYLIIHDYMAEKGGFEGVKKATDEYFTGKQEIHFFYENTMALVKF